MPRHIANALRRLIVLLAVVVLAGCAGCATSRQMTVAPPKYRRYYQHKQRVHERERRKRYHYGSDAPLNG